jgi:hypothetical protein
MHIQPLKILHLLLIIYHLLKWCLLLGLLLMVFIKINLLWTQIGNALFILFYLKYSQYVKSCPPEDILRFYLLLDYYKNKTYNLEYLIQTYKKLVKYVINCHYKNGNLAKGMSDDELERVYYHIRRLIPLGMFYAKLTYIRIGQFIFPSYRRSNITTTAPIPMIIKFFSLYGSIINAFPFLTNLFLIDYLLLRYYWVLFLIYFIILKILIKMFRNYLYTK